MAQKKIILCDTNIIIEYFKRNAIIIISQLQTIGESNIYVSTITSCELFFGALNKKELHQIKKKIELIVEIPINEAISELSKELVFKHSLSHRLSIPDAMIAATALYYEIELFTLNKKDFKYIDGLQLYL